MGPHSEEEPAKLAKVAPPPPPADVVKITDEASHIVTFGKLRHDLSDDSMAAIERKIANHQVTCPLRPVELLLHYRHIGWRKEPRLDHKTRKGDMAEHLAFLCHKHVGTVAVQEFDDFMNSMEQSAIFTHWVAWDSMVAKNPSAYNKSCVHQATFGEQALKYAYGKFPKEKPDKNKKDKDNKGFKKWM